MLAAMTKPRPKPTLSTRHAPAPGRARLQPSPTRSHPSAVKAIIGGWSYSRWIGTTIKVLAAVTILTAFVTRAQEFNRDRATLARLAANAVKAKPPLNTGQPRR